MNRPTSRALWAVAIFATSTLGPIGPPAALAGLVINSTFLGGTPPPNMAGGGNLVTIFNMAVSAWEAAFP